MKKDIFINSHNISKQYFGHGSNIEYIELQNNLVIPIFPNFIIKKIDLLSHQEIYNSIISNNINIFNLINIIYNNTNLSTSYSKIKIDEQYKKFDKNKNFNYLLNYYYNIDSICIEKINDNVYVTGVLFLNGLIMPLIPVLYSNKNKII